jgi:hypothetical protein
MSPRRKRIAFVSVLLLTLPATLLLLPAPPGQPKTVAQAVRQVLDEKWLSEEDRDWILRNPREAVCANLHMTLGLTMRNTFGLWGDNWRLKLSCLALHPENCSWKISSALWQAVRDQADPKLVKSLDAQFQRLEGIKIDYSRFNDITIAELVSRIQEQMDKEQIGTPTSSRVRLKLIGDPDLKGYTRAEFAVDGKPPASLQTLLGWISWRNGFRVKNDPPFVELVFYEKRAWPAPPHFKEER